MPASYAERRVGIAAAIGARVPSLQGLLRPFMRRAQLHYVLFLALTMIATVPVGILAVWVEQSAYRKELAAVREGHLLIARNTSFALTRYTGDVEAVFSAVTARILAGTADGSETPLLSALNIDHVSIVAPDDRIVGAAAGLSSAGRTDLPAREDLDRLRGLASAGGAAKFSGIMLDGEGRPTVYLTRALDRGRFAVGALNTRHLVALQQSIVFGERGHAVIVDQNGSVIAHPSAPWRQDMRDLSGIYPVQQILAGLTGVTTYFSPATNTEMIAAYASVPGLGWGVMVPQPLNELAGRARSVETLAIRITVVGLLIACLLSWLLARHIAGPMERVAATAREIADGKLEARVVGLPRTLPYEIDEMARSFNFMVSRLSVMNAELAATAVRAESANRAKTQFMANMSHEFRTPLNAIIGFTEVMRDRIFGPLGNEKYAAYVGDIHRSASHLGSMIKEILDLTKAEQGQMALDVGPVVLDEVVDLALRMVNQKAEEKQLTITKDVASDLPTLMSDAVKLRQVLLNLLSNAVKFTPAKGVIKVHVARADDGISLLVRDTGIGIDPRDMEKVMEPFGQVANAFSRSHEGTGLGLPLSQELVDLLGGRMRIESEVGLGTKVTVWLPLHPEPPVVAEGASTTRPV